MSNSDRFLCPRCHNRVPMAHALTESVYGERMCSDCWDDEEGGYWPLHEGGEWRWHENPATASGDDEALNVRSRSGTTERT